LLVVSGLLSLLAHGIHADRTKPEIEELVDSWRESERLAA